MLKLVTFEDLAAMLGLQKESIDEYPSLKLLISSVYAAIESYTGRILEFDTYTERVDTRNRLVPVQAYPITAVTAVIADNDPTTNMATACTRMVGHVQLPREVNSFVSITYSGGFEDAPAAIKRAALLQTVHEWQRKDQLGAQNVTNDGGSVIWPEFGLLKEVRRLLDPFVHPMKYI